jgi:acylphosphatase
MKQTQRIHIEIKGQLQNLFYPVLAWLHSRTLGISAKSFKNKDNGSIEMVLEGDVSKLWKMVDFAKAGFVFLMVDEVVFKFVDL